MMFSLWYNSKFDVLGLARYTTDKGLVVEISMAWLRFESYGQMREKGWELIDDFEPSAMEKFEISLERYVRQLAQDFVRVFEYEMGEI